MNDRRSYDATLCVAMKHPHTRGERKEINRIKTQARQPIASETSHEIEVRQDGYGSEETSEPVA